MKNRFIRSNLVKKWQYNANFFAENWPISLLKNGSFPLLKKWANFFTDKWPIPLVRNGLILPLVKNEPFSLLKNGPISLLRNGPCPFLKTGQFLYWSKNGPISLLKNEPISLLKNDHFPHRYVLFKLKTIIFPIGTFWVR